MGKEWIQKGKSYLKDIPLESVKSKINPGLSVAMVKGRLQLYTHKVIYSWEDLYYNLQYTADHLDWTKYRPEEILVLGFGLGSVVQIIEKKVDYPLQITAVELDENVLYLAQKYTVPKFRSPIEFICTDAWLYVMQTRKKYDLITLDVFLDDIIPEKLETLEFMQKLKKLLHPNGLILFNRIAMEPEHKILNTLYYEKIFRPLFPTSDILEVKTNWVLISSNEYLI